MKKFCDIKVGDSVFFTCIRDCELPKEDAIMELKVVSITGVTNSLNMKINLSNDTFILTSGMFAFHSTHRHVDDVTNLTCDIYATSKEECIHIARNSVNIAMKTIHRMIEACKDRLDKLGEDLMLLYEFEKNIPTEVVAETVMV